MVLRGRRINSFADFSLNACSAAMDIWVSSINFYIKFLGWHLIYWGIFLGSTTIIVNQEKNFRDSPKVMLVHNMYILMIILCFFCDNYSIFQISNLFTDFCTSNLITLFCTSNYLTDSYHSNYFTDHYSSNFFQRNFFTNNFFTLFFFTG